MNDTQMLKAMRLRAPEVEEQLARDLIAESKAYVCAYTGRASVPDALQYAVLQIALMRYNRMGIEGEASHSEGTSRSIDAIPDDLRRQLNPYRLARTR